MTDTLNIAGSQVFIEGSGPRTIVMLHGWPDTHALWRAQVDFLKHHYTCVSFTMPGFAPEDQTNHTLDDIVQRIGAIVDGVASDRKVILLAHDWGCVFGYEYAMRHSGRIESMIGLDVGDVSSDAFQQSLSLAGKLMIFSYQVCLAISFVAPRLIGNPMARGMARALRAKSVRTQIHVGMSMPYAMRWLGVNGGLKHLLAMQPSFPFYYGYATQKPVMFHSSEWLEALRVNPDNRIEPFHCGHWIPVDAADALNASLANWLDDSGL
ncbi:MAG: alpha/beta fold hydrolase [Pseudomonadota bacterium]